MELSRCPSDTNLQMHILRNTESEMLHLCTFHIHLMSKTLTENIFPESTAVHQIDMNWSEGSVPIGQFWLNNCNYYTVGGDSWNFSLHPRLLLFTSASSHSHSALSHLASFIGSKSQNRNPGKQNKSVYLYRGAFSSYIQSRYFGLLWIPNRVHCFATPVVVNVRANMFIVMHTEDETFFSNTNSPKDT